MVCKLAVKVGFHFRVKHWSIEVHLIPKELGNAHSADLILELDQHVVPGLVARIAHRDAVRMCTGLDVPPSKTYGDDVFDGHARGEFQGGRTHSGKTGRTVLALAVVMDGLHPMVVALLSLREFLWKSVGFLKFRRIHLLEVIYIIYGFPSIKVLHWKWCSIVDCILNPQVSDSNLDSQVMSTRDALR